MILKIFQNLKKGFTIIELLVAITVLIIGIVAILYMFPISVQVEKYSQQLSIAVQLAQEKTEETISKAYLDTTVGTTTESQLPAPFQKYSRQTVINYVDSNFNPTTTDTGLKKIIVKVTFENPLGFDKKVEISTLITNK
jgi:type II secretory pathway pseudopilin PulG